MSTRQPRTDLEAEHAPERIRHRLRNRGDGGQLGDAVLGAIDGSITSFVVVAGAIGAGFSSLVVLVLGFASLLADGFSMAAGNYLGTKAQRERADQAEREELRHIEVVPEGQREELRQIFAAKGLDGETLERVVDTIATDRRLWARTVVSEAFGLQSADPAKPRRAAVATFVAFLLAGLVPLLPFVVLAAFQPAAALQQAFVASIVATTITFIAIGMLKGQALGQGRIRAGVETLAIGGVAAVLAYAIGALLQAWLGGWALG